MDGRIPLICSDKDLHTKRQLSKFPTLVNKPVILNLKLMVLMVCKYLIFLQGLSVSLAYDAIQVINQALHKELCSSLNGSNSLPADREVMFNCMKKVTTNTLFCET